MASSSQRDQSPEKIAPAFDDTELGTAIGERMRSCVFRDIRRWLDTGLAIGRIAINVSAAEFRRDNYAERVLEDLRRMDVPASCLEVEVTESVFLGSGAEFVERALRTLSAEGVTIALDDFGTGYASLSHLKRFPVDAIKIDRTFVSGLETDADDAAIVRAFLVSATISASRSGRRRRDCVSSDFSAAHELRDLRAGIPFRPPHVCRGRAFARHVMDGRVISVIPRPRHSRATNRIR